MITDEERRDVAREMRIRALEGYGFSGPSIAEEIGVHEADFEDGHLFDEACWRLLADLIEPQERTCKAAGEDPLGFRLCSSCGYESWADEDSVTPYCPMCGAKVVE